MDRRFREALRRAILERDVRTVAELVDQLRFRFGGDYEMCFSLASELTGVSESDWDGLLYEADELER